MNPHRRHLLAAGLTGLAGVATFGAWRAWPDEGPLNPCAGALPPDLADHSVVRDAWAGPDAAQVVDTHVHLLGVGDAINAPTPPHADGLSFENLLTSSAGFNPAEGTLRWPLAQGQRAFFLNATCVNAPSIDRAYSARLKTLADDFPTGARVLLLALDGFHDEAGRGDPARTHVWVGNDYCAAVAKAAPERFLWAASIHPYRADAAAELARVQALGARAVKWIPSAQGIDPASPKCDAFYAALARLDLPLITHAGTERAAPGDDELGNPLKLRRALEHGVRVVVAHCASMGGGRDLDAGANGPAASNFKLFERLMDEPKSAGKLFGDLSALAQRARAGVLRRVIERSATDWSGRLLNGSDYPLPGIMPLFLTRGLAEAGLIATSAVEPLVQIRRHNPMLCDFSLKRLSKAGDRVLSGTTFAMREFFERRRPTGT